MEDRRLIVVGAGASKSHSRGSFPLVTEVFRTAAELGIDIDNPHPDGSYQDLLRYSLRSFPGVLGNVSDATSLEEFFSHLEIDIEHAPTPSLHAARNQSLRFISEVIGGLTRKLSGEPSGYHHLANLLRPSDAVLESIKEMPRVVRTLAVSLGVIYL